MKRMSDEELNEKAKSLDGESGIIFSKGQRILELFCDDQGRINAGEALMVVGKVHAYLIQRIAEKNIPAGLLERLIKMIEADLDEALSKPLHKCDECDDLTCDKKIESIIKGE